MLAEITERSNDFLLHEGTTDYVNLSATRRDRAIQNGIISYSRLRPLEDLYAETATSDNWYDLPVEFERGFSSIVNIEYPIEETPTSLLDDKNYGIEQMATGWKLRFYSSAPASGRL